MKTHYLLTTTLIAASLLSIQSASAASSGSSYDPSNGRTITSNGNADGSHTVTVTERNGKSTTTVRGKLAPGIYVGDGENGWKRYNPPPKPPPGPTGISVVNGKHGLITYNTQPNCPTDVSAFSLAAGNTY